MKVDKLMNWGEISRILAGARTSISRTRIPKKHAKKIAELRAFLEKWAKQDDF